MLLPVLALPRVVTFACVCVVLLVAVLARHLVFFSSHACAPPHALMG